MNCDFCEKALPSRKEVSMRTLSMCVIEYHQVHVPVCWVSVQHILGVFTQHILTQILIQI